MTYDLKFEKTAKKDLHKLEKREKQRLISKLEWFSKHPDRSKNVKYIEKFDCLRYRVGKIRAFFEKDTGNKEIRILSIEKRPRAYR